MRNITLRYGKTLVLSLSLLTLIGCGRKPEPPKTEFRLENGQSAFRSDACVEPNGTEHAIRTSWKCDCNTCWCAQEKNGKLSIYSTLKGCGTDLLP